MGLAGYPSSKFPEAASPTPVLDRPKASRPQAKDQHSVPYDRLDERVTSGPVSFVLKVLEQIHGFQMLLWRPAGISMFHLQQSGCHEA